jgi:hypothetical protein
MRELDFTERNLKKECWKAIPVMCFSYIHVDIGFPAGRTAAKICCIILCYALMEVG